MTQGSIRSTSSKPPGPSVLFRLLCQKTCGALAPLQRHLVQQMQTEKGNLFFSEVKLYSGRFILETLHLYFYSLTSLEDTEITLDSRLAVMQMFCLYWC